MRVGVYYDGSKDGAAQAALSLARDLRLQRNQVLVRDLTVWRHDSVERFERVVVVAEPGVAATLVAAYSGRAAVEVLAEPEPDAEATQAPARSRRKN